MSKKLMMFAQAHGLVRFNKPPDDAPSGGPVPTPPAPSSSPDAQVFDQAKVTEIATREHDRGTREGKRQADQAWLDRLGIESVEDAEALAALAKAAKEADERNRTQAERDAEQAAKDRAAAAADRAAAKAERHASTLERVLSAAGMPPETQAYITVPGLTVDSTPEEVEAKVAEMKTSQPALFGAPLVAPPNAPGVPPAAPRLPQGTFGGEGARRFESQAARQASRTPHV